MMFGKYLGEGTSQGEAELKFRFPFCHLRRKIVGPLGISLPDR